jgi:hypothetical protein
MRGTPALMMSATKRRLTFEGCRGRAEVCGKHQVLTVPERTHRQTLHHLSIALLPQRGHARLVQRDGAPAAARLGLLEAEHTSALYQALSHAQEGTVQVQILPP